MSEIRTYPEMNEKLAELLRISDDPSKLYAAARIEELEKDLAANASMLARQCDLAREAESRAERAVADAVALREGIRTVGHELEDGEYPSRAARSLRELYELPHPGDPLREELERYRSGGHPGLVMREENRCAVCLSKPIEFAETDGTLRRIVHSEGDPSVGIGPGWESDDNAYDDLQARAERYKQIVDAVFAWDEKRRQRSKEIGGALYMTTSDHLECELILTDALLRYGEGE